MIRAETGQWPRVAFIKSREALAVSSHVRASIIIQPVRPLIKLMLARSNPPNLPDLVGNYLIQAIAHVERCLTL